MLTGSSWGAPSQSVRRRTGLGHASPDQDVSSSTQHHSLQGDQLCLFVQQARQKVEVHPIYCESSVDAGVQALNVVVASDGAAVWGPEDWLGGTAPSPRCLPHNPETSPIHPLSFILKACRTSGMCSAGRHCRQCRTSTFWTSDRTVESLFENAGIPWAFSWNVKLYTISFYLFF